MSLPSRLMALNACTGNDTRPKDRLPFQLARGPRGACLRLDLAMPHSFTNFGNCCFNSKNPFQGSDGSDLSRSGTLSTRKWSDLMRGESSSQASGVETVALGFARVEYGATAVAPR